MINLFLEEDQKKYNWNRLKIVLKIYVYFTNLELTKTFSWNQSKTLNCLWKSLNNSWLNYINFYTTGTFLLIKQNFFVPIKLTHLLFFNTSTKSLRGYIFTTVCLCVCLSICLSGSACEQNSSQTDEPIWTRFSLNGCLPHWLKTYWNW